MKGTVTDLEEQLLQQQKNNERFELVVESSPNGIIVANENGEIVLVNHMAETLFGYDREEFLNLSIKDLVPRRIREPHRQNRNAFHAHPETRQMGMGRDLSAIKKDGSEFPVEIGLTPLPGENGMLVLSTIIDITERKRIANELESYAAETRKSRDSLKLQGEILKNVHDAVFYLSEDGTILEWNQGAARIFETNSEKAIGSSILEICQHEGAHSFTDRIVPVVKEKGVAEEIIYCRLNSGEEITIRANVTALSQEGEAGYIVCASDITKQKKLEAEILRVSENEQRRIGQDLHDDLCSQLSGIGMMTKVLETQLKESHEKESNLLAEISKMVADAGQKARGLAKGLIPSALETHGLSRAIHDMADQSKTLFGLECIATILGPVIVDSVSPSVGIQLYRIAQEATTNAMKHSDAKLVQIRISGEDGRIDLEVSDDGKGIHDDIISNGLGMMTMRQRADMINADFELHSVSGKGTRIFCSLKLPREPNAKNVENSHCR